MRLLTETFNKMRELTAFVNSHNISKENMLPVFQTNDGLFVLTYFEKE